jgi:hypothetical protein
VGRTRALGTAASRVKGPGWQQTRPSNYGSPSDDAPGEPAPHGEPAI